MKTSWIIFIVFAYLGIRYFAGVAEYSSLMNSQISQQLYNLGTPTGLNFLGVSASQISAVWDYIVVFIQMIFLWNGTLWVGSWLYFYYFVCIPVCIGVVMSIVFILRGVHNS